MCPEINSSHSLKGSCYREHNIYYVCVCPSWDMASTSSHALNRVHDWQQEIGFENINMEVPCLWQTRRHILRCLLDCNFCFTYTMAANNIPFEEDGVFWFHTDNCQMSASKVKSVVQRSSIQCCTSCTYLGLAGSNSISYLAHILYLANHYRHMHSLTRVYGMLAECDSLLYHCLVESDAR